MVVAGFRQRPTLKSPERSVNHHSYRHSVPGAPASAHVYGACPPWLECDGGVRNRGSTVGSAHAWSTHGSRSRNWGESGRATVDEVGLGKDPRSVLRIKHLPAKECVARAKATQPPIRGATAKGTVCQPLLGNWITARLTPSKPISADGESQTHAVGGASRGLQITKLPADSERTEKPRTAGINAAINRTRAVLNTCTNRSAHKSSVCGWMKNRAAKSLRTSSPTNQFANATISEA